MNPSPLFIITCGIFAMISSEVAAQTVPQAGQQNWVSLLAGPIAAVVLFIGKDLWSRYWKKKEDEKAAGLTHQSEASTAAVQLAKEVMQLSSAERTALLDRALRQEEREGALYALQVKMIETQMAGLRCDLEASENRVRELEALLRKRDETL